MSQPHRRPNFSALDLLRALAPLVVLILVVVWLSTPSGVTPIPEVDPVRDLTYAADLADFDVVAPVGLPDGWRATSARVDPAVDGGPVGVVIGYVTPEERFAQVVQSSQELAVETTLGPGYVLGEELDVDGAAWRQARTADDEVALLREMPGDAVLVVTGSAGLAELRTLAAALQPL